MLPDLLLALALLRLELLQVGDRRVLPRDELFLLLGIQRLLFRRDREVALEAIELVIRALAIAAAFAQLLLRSACPLLGEDARIVRGAKILFDRLQLRGDTAGARLLGAEERFEIGELAFEREDAGSCILRLAADDQRTANDVAFERDERRTRALLRSIQRLAERADDVRLGQR